MDLGKGMGRMDCGCTLDAVVAVVKVRTVLTMMSCPEHGLVAAIAGRVLGHWGSSSWILHLFAWCRCRRLFRFGGLIFFVTYFSDFP